MMEENSEGGDFTEESVKEENIANSECINTIGEFVECKEEPLELEDYVEFAEEEVNTLADCEVENICSLGGSESRDSPTFLEAALSFSDDETDIEDILFGGENKRKRESSESEKESFDDDSSDGGELEEELTGRMKKRAISWTTDPSSMCQFKFEGEKKIRVPVPGENKPLDWFNLLLTEDYLTGMVEETNKCAQDILSDPKLDFKTRFLQWRPITLQELKVFIGLIYHMGTVKLYKLQHYWRTDEMYDFKYVRTRMTRVRFFHILKCLSVPAMAKGTHVQTSAMVAWFNETMERIYYPDKHLVVDEGFALGNGRKQFSNEFLKGGFKLYSLSEPAGPVLRFSMRYKGEKSALTRISKELLEGKAEGHSVIFNVEHFDPVVAKELQKIKIHSTGYLREECYDIPAALRQVKLTLRKCTTAALYAEGAVFNGILLGKWKHRGPETYYLSTEFDNRMVKSPHGRNKKNEIPLPILKLRAKKLHSITDNVDPLVDFYPAFSQKYMSFNKRLFIHLLQILMYNAYKLHVFSTPEKLDFMDFREDVIKTLLISRKDVPKKARKPTSTRRKTPKWLSASGVGEVLPAPGVVHELIRFPVLDSTKRAARRRCLVCVSEGLKDKKTVFYCAQCPGAPGLCPNCFYKYHGDLGLKTKL